MSRKEFPAVNDRQTVRLRMYGFKSDSLPSVFTFAASFLTEAMAELDGLQDPSTVFC